MAIRRHGRILAAGLFALATAVVATGTPAAAAPATGEIRLAGSADAIPGSYIVVLKSGAQQAKLSKAYGASVKRSFGKALNGFEATMSETQAKRLAANSEVAFVEQNQ